MDCRDTFVEHAKSAVEKEQVSYVLLQVWYVLYYLPNWAQRFSQDSTFADTVDVIPIVILSTFVSRPVPRPTPSYNTHGVLSFLP